MTLAGHESNPLKFLAAFQQSLDIFSEKFTKFIYLLL